MIDMDPSQIPHERTNKARASDEYQSKLVDERQRVFSITFAALVIMEIGLWYWGAPSWVMVVVPLLWIGLLMHNNALLILHELWEMNDQIAGRKDEFCALLTEKGQGDDNKGGNS